MEVRRVSVDILYMIYVKHNFIITSQKDGGKTLELLGTSAIQVRRLKSCICMCSKIVALYIYIYQQLH